MFKTELSHEIWKKEYRYGTEEPIETFQRVARALADTEIVNKDEWYDKFLKLLVKYDDNGIADGLKFTPGGRITANAGTSFKKATMINCFVSGPISGADIKYTRKSDEGDVSFDVKYKTDENPDDLMNIFLTIAEQAKTLASEGGYGINFGFIRPRGSIIKGTGIKHPGVMAYMKIWDSVSECIVKGSDDGYVDLLKNFINDDKVFGEVKDNIKKKIRKGAMMGALPCVSGDTLISTLNGKLPIKDLVDKRPYLYCTDSKGTVYVRQADKIWKTGTRKTLKILFDDDSHLICTPEHLIMLKDGTYQEASQLTFGQSVAAFHKIIYIRKGVEKIVGTYRIGITGARKTIPEHIAVGEMKYGRYPTVKYDGDRKIYSDFSEDIHHIDGNSLNNNPDNLEMLTRIEHRKRHEKETSICFEKNRKRITDDRRGKTWEEYYGPEKAELVRSRYSRKRKGQPSWNKGLTADTYKSHFKNGFKNQFNDEIKTWEDAYGQDKASEAKHKKTETLRKNLALANHKVVSITEHETIDVFDISVPDFHNFVANDIFVHNCSHPDIEEFVKAKQEKGVLTKFNTSVLIDDAFMTAVENDSLYDLHFKGVVYKRIKAKELYDLIMESCYNRGEPGVLFFDNMQKNNPISYLGKVNCSNPCGEVTGLPTLTTVCLLGSFNLSQYVYIDESRKPCFDFEGYTEDIKTATRLLDNVNDLSYGVLPPYEWAIKNLRQIGMGLNAVGSALAMLKIPYNSPEAIAFIEKLSKIKENMTWQASAYLAKEKGVFTTYKKDLFENTEYFKSDRLTEETKNLLRKYGARNAKTTTNPPLGNGSLLCNSVSNGIEPIYKLDTERTVICTQWPEGLDISNVKRILTEKKGKDFTYWQGNYKGILYYYEEHNRGLCEKKVIRDYGYQWLLDNFPNDNHSAYLITTKDLEVDDHISIQAIAQYYCNQSISKTINVNKSFPFSKFKEMYIKGWKKGLIGVTAYRDGSMEAVLSEISKAENSKEIMKRDIKLPDTFINGDTRIIKKEGKKFYITFSYLPSDNDKSFPICMWIQTNAAYKEKDDLKLCNKAARELAKLAYRSGIDEKLITEAVEKTKEDYPHNRLGRMISLNLRHNVPRERILMTITDLEGDGFSTLLFSVRKFLAETIPNGTVLPGYKCPSCGSTNVYLEAGCKKCKDCQMQAC